MSERRPVWLLHGCASALRLPQPSKLVMLSVPYDLQIMVCHRQRCRSFRNRALTLPLRVGRTEAALFCTLQTSLLDFVRKTKVAAGEAGGITQAIGAYTVQVSFSKTLGYGQPASQPVLYDHGCS